MNDELKEEAVEPEIKVVEKVVEKIVEVPVEKIVERVVEVEKPGALNLTKAEVNGLLSHLPSWSERGNVMSAKAKLLELLKGL